MNQKKPLPFIAFLALFAAIALFPSLPAIGAETADYEVVSCDCGAFVVDTDPAGLNVRSGPGSDYSVVTKLPTNRPVEVTITGASGPWMRISEAYIFVEEGPSGDIDMKLDGWIYGPLLGVDAQRSDIDPAYRPNKYYPDAVPLYAEPDADSAIVGPIPALTTVTILGCKDKWLKVRYKNLEGWLGNYCPSAVTTCP